MDFPRFLRIVFLLGYCSCYCSRVVANDISLKKAMNSKRITLNAISNGGASGKSIKLQLTNNTAEDITIDVDPALIFVPEDTVLQNLVLLGNETLVLKANSKSDVDLQTFCGKSYGHCPRKNVAYHYWKQGDSNMIKVLTYARQNNIAIPVIQRAVWTFTNGHCLNTVYLHEYIRMSEDLVKYMASLRKIRVPDIFMEYNTAESPNEAVLVPGDQKVYVNIHWTDEGYRHMYLTVYKENGEIYKNIEADRVIDKYGYTVVVQFDPHRDPKGTYIVRLYDDARKVWNQKIVVVGPHPCDM